MRDLVTWSLRAQLRAAARDEVSVTEIVQAHLRQIERVQDTLHAFTYVRRREALAGARAADRIRRGERGRLHGAVLSIKDNIAEAGKPNTAGTGAWAHRIASRDADVVGRLRSLGAVLIARTNLHELAAGITTANPHFGVALNPWDTGRIPGGSSGGAAIAVATGCCAAAIGTDTGGSIRIPAAMCGVVGLKPTYDRISRRGVVPLAWSLDHVGLIARSVGDAEILFRVLMRSYGEVDRAPSRRGARDPNRADSGVFGIEESLTRRASAPVRRALSSVSDALSATGMKPIALAMPHLTEALAAQYVIGRSETASAHEYLLLLRRPPLGADVRARIEAGLRLSAVDYLRAQRVRSLFIERLGEVFAKCDVLLLPATPVVAPPHDQLSGRVGGRPALRDLYMRFTAPFNLAGTPALVMPVGRDAHGLPLSVQLAGPAFGDEHLLQLARALEASLPELAWPPIASIDPPRRPAGYPRNTSSPRRH